MTGHFQLFQSHWWQLNSILCHYNATTILWDPAYDQKELEEISDQASLLDATSKSLVFTHGDYDHIVGEATFKEYHRVGSTAFEAKTNKKQVLQQIEQLDHEFYVERSRVPEFPSLDIIITSENPTRMALGNLEVHFYRAAGHTEDGLFTVVPELGLWVAGDYLSDIEFPFVEDRVTNYYETLATARKILTEYTIQVMVPGHGKPAYSKTEIQTRIDQSEQYLNGLSQKNIPDWRVSWGPSPFTSFLDKMHQKNIRHVNSQNL